MENGEGRPLDEEEAGGEDPQGWYFDLPGGAWERQEEKNRTLRQRVLGNISEDAEKAKSDPFTRRTPEPEAPARGGLFGFGRKKKQAEPPRESAGGTWTLSGSQGSEENPNGAEPEEADDWSTEIPLNLEPPKDLTLHRRPEAEHGEPWAAADAGWSIGAEDRDGEGEADTASIRDDAQDFRDRMQFWARGGQAEPGPEMDETAGELEDIPAPADVPLAGAVEAPRTDGFAVDEAVTIEETPPTDEDFISGMRSWANDSPGSAVEEDGEDVPTPARNDVLQLRPRTSEPGEKRLDWGFQAAGWSQPADHNNDSSAAAGDEPARFSGGPDEPDEPADLLGSMRRWAEHAKESEHPHFALQHHGDDEVAGGEPPVIPLRPRNHEDDADEHAPSDETPETAEPDQPRTIPIVLRSRTEPQPETVNRDADEAPTRWDEFFGLDQPDQGDDDSETSDTPGEGLAAMRDWAMKRPETETEHEIPEEFLKPFDWELGDDDSTDTAGQVIADAAELSEWEAEDEPVLAAFAVETAEEAQDEPPDTQSDWIAGAAALENQPETVAPTALVSGDTGEVDEDPLAGLFDHPAVPAAPEKKRGGMFGRLFGRKKQEPDPAPAPASVDHEPGDWILPEDDSDVRTVAAEGSPAWVAAEVEDQPGVPSPHGVVVDSLNAREAEVSPAEDDGFDDGWVEVDEPSPGAVPEEMVTALGSPAVSEVAEAPVAESGWAPEEASEAVPQGEQAAEPATFDVGDASQEEADEFAWEPEPVTYEEPAASTAEPGGEEPEDATPLIAAFQLSLGALGGSDGAAEPVVEEPDTGGKPWWEQPAAEEEAPAEAVASAEPVAGEKPWWEQPAAEEEEPVEAVASVEPVTEEPVAGEKPWWEQAAVEEEAPAEAVASAEPVAEEKPWWEQPAVEEEAPAEAVASVEPVAEEPVADEKPWWEQPAAEEEEPVAAVASVEPVAEEPVAGEKPWWEQPAAEEEAPVEAVASVEPVAEEPVADDASVEPAAEEPVAGEKTWWEQPAVEEEAPVEAVASVEPVVEEPVAGEKPWWEQPAVEEEAPAEAVASVEPVAEEPVADEKPWWEQPAAEEEEPVAAVASVEPVAEEPDAGEKPWWEQPAAEEEAPVEAVASVEPVTEEPVADEKPWWEQAAADEDAPVEAVASVEPVVEESVADEKPWWEQPAAEEEAPAEAVASAEPVAEESVADEKPWWEQPAAEEEAPAEAVASVEPVAEEPVDDEKPWWEQPAVEEEAPAEAVASVEPAAEEPVLDGDDDDPWAEFVSGEPETDTLPSAAASLAGSWAATAPAWTPPAPPSAEHDEDMWGDIAAQTEEAAFGAEDGPGIDLAASLESQMAERPIEAPRDWESAGIRPARPGYDDEQGAFEPEEADEDVILRAFERHAATPDPEAQPDPAAARETEEALAALFGQNAAQIVDESGAEAEPQSFMRLSGFAPQRESFDGNWAPEQEVQEVLAHDRAPYGGSDGAGFLPPPWAAEEFGAEGEGAPVRQGSKTKTWIRELVETGLLALLVFLSVRASFQNFKVDGSSMYPTLEDGQFLIVNKLVYSEVDVEKLGKFIPFVDAGDDPKRNVFHGPQRGDIVVLQDPRKPETDLIKRVIGLPGETVEIVGGKVYINDLQLEEPYITSPWNDTKPKILIPDGEYYVLGDNRDNSLDSRSSQVGLVPADLIIGKAMLSYWPRDKFGLAPNEGGSLGDQKPVLTTKRIGED